MGSIGPADRTGLDVIVVGAGIAGLGVATALSQKGHHVTVLERHPYLNEFGASIGIQANGVQCIKAWGLERHFEPFISRPMWWEIINGLTGERIGHLPSNKNNYSTVEFGDEAWIINRKDYQDVLAQGATSAGAQIIFGIELVEINVDKCIALSKDGREFRANVIIGADGMASFVRSQIPAVSDIKPVALVEEQCWRCTAPKSLMRQSSRLKHLLEEPHSYAWSVPGRYVLGWPLVENRDFDIVLCLQKKGDVPPGRWGTKVDPEDGIQHFQDFCPLVVELLSHVETAVKWTLGEVPPLNTCKSKNGRVLLIGDAFHAMIPHSASGGGSAMEDAACVGECLDWAWQRHKQGADLNTAISIATNA